MVAMVLDAVAAAAPFDARESGHGDEHLEHSVRYHDHGGVPCDPGLRKSYCNPESWMGVKGQFSSFVVEIVRKDNMKPAAWLPLHFHNGVVHLRDVYWTASLGEGNALLSNGSLPCHPTPTNKAAPENDYYFNLILLERNFSAKSDLISNSESLPRHLEQYAQKSDGFLHNCVELLEKMERASVKTGNELWNIREVRQRFKT